MDTQEEKNRKYRDRYNKRLKLKKCAICGNEFYGRDKQKHCLNHAHAKPEQAKIKQRIIKKCKICSKKFWGRNNHCSNECYEKYIDSLRKLKIERKCTHCGKQLYLYPCLVREHNFCNKECYALFRVDKPSYKVRGEKHGGWKGGGKKRDNSTLRAKRWRTRVFVRDNYHCLFCEQGGSLVAHHVVAWADDEKLRYYTTNGITLCKKCHKEIHDGNFMKPIDYEKTKNKCQTKGIRLRKEISNRIEELIWERSNRNFEKS